MSISIYGMIPLKELQNDYNIVYNNDIYWIIAKDKGLLHLHIDGDYVNEVEAHGFSDKKERMEIMSTLYNKYNMMSEDEFLATVYENLKQDEINTDKSICNSY